MQSNYWCEQLFLQNTKFGFFRRTVQKCLKFWTWFSKLFSTYPKVPFRKFVVEKYLHIIKSWLGVWAFLLNKILETDIDLSGEFIVMTFLDFEQSFWVKHLKLISACSERPKRHLGARFLAQRKYSFFMTFDNKQLAGAPKQKPLYFRVWVKVSGRCSNQKFVHLQRKTIRARIFLKTLLFLLSLQSLSIFFNLIYRTRRLFVTRRIFFNEKFFPENQFSPIVSFSFWAKRFQLLSSNWIFTSPDEYSKKSVLEGFVSWYFFTASVWFFWPSFHNFTFKFPEEKLEQQFFEETYGKVQLLLTLTEPCILVSLKLTSCQ